MGFHHHSTLEGLDQGVEEVGKGEAMMDLERLADKRTEYYYLMAVSKYTTIIILYNRAR